jgi:glycosyltransferase involved in cell wall biosynthesis
MRIAFIGSVGLPNRYGGFESFLEQCAPAFVRAGHETLVTCDASAYPDDRSADFHGVRRLFIGIRANGAMSILHDLVAFVAVFARATHVVVLGVSGGLFFPLFRLLCSLTGKKLLVNIDGVEWRRTKFSRSRRLILRAFDALAQLSAHVVIYDNGALLPFVLAVARRRARLIGYSGDHVMREPSIERVPGTALTICRIEPENNIQLIIDGALASSVLRRYTIIGNWNGSAYGRELRDRYRAEPRLALLDPVYDQRILAQHRESCAMYIHGHSVGGTNPSLVEILFYDCAIFCFDCDFNRETAGDSARYFMNPEGLARLIDNPEAAASAAERDTTRARFTRDAIANAYLDAMRQD